MVKIDIFSHIMPPKYIDALIKEIPQGSRILNNVINRTSMSNLEHRFKIMDKFEGYAQVLTMSGPALESVVNQKNAVELSRMANDWLAEVVAKYPQRFIAAVACLPMNDIDSSLKELDRAIKDLKLKGILLYSSFNDKPLDSAELLPLYEKMVHYDLPIWIHPQRPVTQSDYKTETKSKYKAFQTFGWPFETTIAMHRLVFSGILEKYPRLKVITHHCGGMLPFFESRIGTERSLVPEALEESYEKLTKHPLDYFKKFYGDTAAVLLPALTCGYQFFKAEHLLFGTDMPFGEQMGEAFIQRAINCVEQLDISSGERAKIFEQNAKKLLKLQSE